MVLNKKQVTAVLGPTNTGKTYLAIETMLGFESGILGFPLRLLVVTLYIFFDYEGLVYRQGMNLRLFIRLYNVSRLERLFFKYK